MGGREELERTWEPARACRARRRTAPTRRGCRPASQCRQVSSWAPQEQSEQPGRARTHLVELGDTAVAVGDGAVGERDRERVLGCGQGSRSCQYRSEDRSDVLHRLRLGLKREEGAEWVGKRGVEARAHDQGLYELACAPEVHTSAPWLAPEPPCPPRCQAASPPSSSPRPTWSTSPPDHATAPGLVCAAELSSRAARERRAHRRTACRGRPVPS